jgi:hypothetical protein
MTMGPVAKQSNAGLHGGAHSMNLLDRLISGRRSLGEWIGRRLQRRIETGPDKQVKADRERQALSKIKDMCSIATESAEKIGLNPHGEESKADRLRFDSAKRISVELLDDITDIPSRDDALVRIIELCLKANDLETGISLIKSVQTASIRERLLKEYPVEFY